MAERENSLLLAELVGACMYVCQESPKKVKNVVSNGTRVPQFCFVVFLDTFSIVTATRHNYFSLAVTFS